MAARVAPSEKVPSRPLGERWTAPRPMKLSEAASSTTPPRSMVETTSSGVKAIGRMCLAMRRRRLAPNDSAATT